MAVVTSWARTYIYTAFENTPPFFFSLSSFYEYMDVSENSGTPKSSILIGCSIIFTIHFGGPPLFLETPILLHLSLAICFLLESPSMIFLGPDFHGISELFE